MKRIPLLFLMGALTSCQTDLNHAKPASSPPIASPLPAVEAPAVAQTPTDKRASAAPSLNSTFRILNVKASEAQTGFLKVEIEVQNVATFPKSFNYRIYWFDDTGTMFDIPDVSGVPLFLMGQEKSSIVALAPTPLAKDFRVTFFPAQ
jgi:uncharacterized protein YcfL